MLQTLLKTHKQKINNLLLTIYLKIVVLVIIVKFRSPANISRIYSLQTGLLQVPPGDQAGPVPGPGHAHLPHLHPDLAGRIEPEDGAVVGVEIYTSWEK